MYADVEIEDAAAPSVNDTQTEEQVVRLNSMVTEIAQHLGNGTFEVGYQVLDVEVLPPQIPLEAAEDGSDTVPPPIVLKPKPKPATPDEGLPSWVFPAVLIVGGAVLLATVIGSFVYWRRDRHRRHQELGGSKVAHVTVAPTDVNTPPHRMRGMSRRRPGAEHSPAPSNASPTQVRFSHSNPMHKEPSPGLGNGAGRSGDGVRRPQAQRQGDGRGGGQGEGEGQRPRRQRQRDEVPLPNSGSMRDVTYRHVGRTAFAPTSAVSALEQEQQAQLPPVHLTPAQKAHFQFTQAYTGWNRGADL